MFCFMRQKIGQDCQSLRTKKLIGQVSFDHLLWPRSTRIKKLPLNYFTINNLNLYISEKILELQ